MTLAVSRFLVVGMLLLACGGARMDPGAPSARAAEPPASAASAPLDDCGELLAASKQFPAPPGERPSAPDMEAAFTRTEKAFAEAKVDGDEAVAIAKEAVSVFHDLARRAPLIEKDLAALGDAAAAMGTEQDAAESAALTLRSRCSRETTAKTAECTKLLKALDGQPSLKPTDMNAPDEFERRVTAFQKELKAARAKDVELASLVRRTSDAYAAVHERLLELTKAEMTLLVDGLTPRTEALLESLHALCPGAKPT